MSVRAEVHWYRYAEERKGGGRVTRTPDGWSAGSWSHGGNEVASGNMPRAEGREEMPWLLTSSLLSPAGAPSG